MNRRKCITLTLIACSVLLLGQRYYLGNLERSLAEKQAEFASLVGNDPAPGAISDPVVDTGEDARRSEKRLSFSDLVEFAPVTTKHRGEPEFVRCLPDLFRAIEDYSALELLALVERGSRDGEDDDKRSDAIAKVLLILVAEQEPERVLAFIEANREKSDHPSGPQMNAFASLARRDPAKACYYLKQANWEDYVKDEDWKHYERQKGEAAIFNAWARRDFRKAVDFLREVSEDDGGQKVDSLLVALAAEEGIPDQFLDAIGAEKNLVVHEKLSTSLGRATIKYSGVEAADELLSELEFPDTNARDEFLKDVAGWGLVEFPDESIEWLLREVSPNNRARILSDKIRSWASIDAEAAGEWLTDQEPSVENSSLFSQYAMEIYMDAPAALEWTEKIANERTQRLTREFIFDQWERRNPDAAEEWLKNRER